MRKKELSTLKSISVSIKTFVYLVAPTRAGFYVCRTVISNDDLPDCFLYFTSWVLSADAHQEITAFGDLCRNKTKCVLSYPRCSR